MSNVLGRIGSVGVWIRERGGAGLTVVLVVTALAVGYGIGHSSSDPASERPAIAHDHAGHSTDDPQAYTCSMHPSVRLSDPDARCPICLMDLIPVTREEDEASERRIAMSESAAAMSRIETARVERFFPTTEVRLYGKVTYDETSVARLTAYFPGRIERLFVNYLGVPVSTGDHIAEVYSPEVLAAFEELRQAAGAAEDSRPGSDLVRSATRDTLIAAREKLRLFGLTEQQIREVESGEHDSDRLTIFAPIGGVVTDLAVREGDSVRTGEPIATVADLSRLWLDMEAYESQLALLRWGQRVSFTVEAHPGQKFEARVSFIEPMVDERTRTAAVRVAVDNTDRRLKPGMFASAVVRTRVASDGAVVNDALAGRWVSPMHPSVVKDGPGQCDVCGMDLVPAESLGVVGDPGSVEEPLVIPRSAVLFTGTRSVVYVEVPETERPTYEGREVVLGPRAGDVHLVREGLREGERVVVNGAFRIDSAMQIAAKPSMMTPDGGGSGDPHAGHGAAIGGNAGRASPTVPGPADIPDGFMSGLDRVYAAYFDAQEALASDDLGGYLRAASALRAALEIVDESGLIGEPQGIWRRASGKLRVDEAVSDIERARAGFVRVSEAIITLERRFGHRLGHGEGNVWHVAHCPMALDNKGASWLQRGEPINNPYFGASMLRCGEIRESFEPIESEATGDRAGQGHDHE